MQANKATDLFVILCVGGAMLISLFPALLTAFERKLNSIKMMLDSQYKRTAAAVSLERRLAPVKAGFNAQYERVSASVSKVLALPAQIQQILVSNGLKRVFDILATSVGLLALFPIFATIAAGIKISSPGPIFYRAKRVGKNGEVFHAYKFRSMVVNADRIGPAVTHAEDSRVTPIGRFLRHYKLDELPQLLNVLKGDMSLVGPRPEDPRYVALYTPQQLEVFKVRPGITSPASVKYRNEESLLVGDDWETKYIQEILPSKLAVDLEYAHNASVWKDFSIIFQTFSSILN